MSDAGSAPDPDRLEGEAFVTERLKEFDEDREDEADEDEVDGGVTAAKPSLDTESKTKLPLSKSNSTPCENIDGKRWSDGGYGYGFDCSQRKWALPTVDDSGISTLPPTEKVAAKREDKESSLKSRTSFDYNYMTTGHLCPAADDVVAVHNRTQIKFVFLRTGRSRLYAPPASFANNRGIGVMAGRDDLSVIAWSDIGPPAPKIHVYQYSSPSDLKTLEGDAVLEYISMAFNHERYLIALSGVPEYQFTLWDWPKETKLHVVSTDIRGPCNLSFGPNLGVGPSRLLLVEPLQGQVHRGEGMESVGIWRIKKCGENTRLVREEKLPGEIKSCEHMSATWAFPNYLFVLSRQGSIMKYEAEKRELKHIELDQRLEEILKGPLSPNTYLKAHYDGLILVMPTVAVIFKMKGVLPCSGVEAQVVKELQIGQICCNLYEFHNSYRFISWTPEGNIYNIQTTEKDIQPSQIMNNNAKKKYISGVFLQPDETHFATLDTNNFLQVFVMQGKEEVFSYQFPVECTLLLCHPKDPILFVGSSDGRMFMVAVDIEYVQQDANGSDEDDDDEDDYYNDTTNNSGDHEKGELEGDRAFEKSSDLYGNQKQGTFKISGKVFGEKGVHQHALDFGETDPQGQYLVTGAKNMHKIYLCDIQKSENVDKRYGGVTKKPKFKPSLDKKSGDSLTNKENESQSIVDSEDKSYFKIKSSANLEGILLDTSFAQKIVICLTCTITLEDDEETKESKSTQTCGDQITIFKVDKQIGSISIANVLNTKEMCSGICLTEHAKTFSTILHKRKKLAKFKVLEHERQSKLTPVSAIATSHEMDIYKIVRARDRRGFLALAGRDGYLSFQPEDETPISNKSQEISSKSQFMYMFHYETGGIVEVSISKSNGSVLVVSKSGAIQVLQTKINEARRQVHSYRGMPSPLMTEVNKLSSIRISPQPSQISWAQKQEEERTAKERQKYEVQINEVTNALDELRTNVAKLLKENEKLPESERIDRHEFELDVDEQQRRKNEGLDKEEDLMLELRAWQLARKKVGRKIKKEVWDDMEVKGRCIKGMKDKLTVSNYPLKPTTMEEDELLEQVKEERRLALEISGTSNDNSTHSRSLASPVPLSGASGGNPSSGSNAAKQSMVGKELEQDIQTPQDVRLLGSRSYEFIDISSCLLYPQLEVTTRSQARQQIILLQDVVRKLKHEFNIMFDDLYQFKDDTMKQINSWTNQLKNVMGDISAQSKAKTVEDEQVVSDTDGKHGKEDQTDIDLERHYCWSPSENPELDLPASDDETEKKEATDEGSGEKSKKAAVGNKLEQKKNADVRNPGNEFEVEAEEVAQPDIMTDKSMVDYAPAEISALEQYQSTLRSLDTRRYLKKRQLEVNCVDHKRKIREAIKEFDERLLALYKKRLAIEKCILAEELKILLHDRQLALHDKLDREEEQLIANIQTTQDMKDFADEEMIEGRRVLTAMKEHSDALKEHDRSMEKNFKKEFPGFGFNQLEALNKCFKKRPRQSTAEMQKQQGMKARQRNIRQDTSSSRASIAQQGQKKDLKTKTIAAALERMTNMFRNTMQKKTPSASVVIAMSLDELDRPAHCPEHVDLDSWKHLCKIRRLKIDSEKGIAALESDIAETQEAVEEREAEAAALEQALTESIEGLETWRKDRNYRLNNTEIVLTVPQGQLEVKPQLLQPNLEGAILITEPVITKLNQDIQKLGDSKLSAMTESKDFRSGTRSLLWEEEKLTLEYEDLQAKWTEIQQTKLPKESRHALQDEGYANRPSLTQEYSNLDKASRATEQYLKKKIHEYDQINADLKEMTKAKHEENKKLEREVFALQCMVDRKRKEVEEDFEPEMEDRPERMNRIVQRNQLVQKIKDQNEVLMAMQEQLDTYMFKSFPSLG